jgi:hypothetical protein
MEIRIRDATLSGLRELMGRLPRVEATLGFEM